MVTMFGWLSRASMRPSRVNRSANAGSAASDAGRIFRATKPIDLRLPGLEDEAHAALADQFQDFKLREGCGQFLVRWRSRFGRRVLPGLSRNADLLEKAFGAKSLRRLSGNWPAALRTPL